MIKRSFDDNSINTTREIQWLKKNVTGPTMSSKKIIDLIFHKTEKDATEEISKYYKELRNTYGMEKI